MVWVAVFLSVCALAELARLLWQAGDPHDNEVLGPTPACGGKAGGCTVCNKDTGGMG
jgi:hypothetical protein